MTIILYNKVIIDIINIKCFINIEKGNDWNKWFVLMVLIVEHIPPQFHALLIFKTT